MTAKAVAAVFAAALLAGCATAPPSGITTSPTPTGSTSTSASPTPSATPTPSASPTPSTSRTPTPHPSASPTRSSDGAAGLPQWLRDGVVTRLPTTRRVVALTFDGGSGAQGAPAVLAALAAADVHATFFLTGNFVRDNPLVVSAITRGGHVIGNHTATHPHVRSISSAALRREVEDTAARIHGATGMSPQPWFRFPYGEYDARSLAVVHDLGYGAIGWTVDTLGWKGREAGTASDVVTRVLRGLRPGEIVLMHLGANPDDGTTYDAAALPRVIAAVRAAGYGFVVLTPSVASSGSGPSS